MVTKTKILTGLLLTLFFRLAPAWLNTLRLIIRWMRLFLAPAATWKTPAPIIRPKPLLASWVSAMSAAPTFQAYPGFNTSDRILLEVNVAGGVFDFGILDTSQVHARTTTFTVRDYLSSGYSVQLTGSPPRNGSYTLSADEQCRLL
jgi:hypothetical protein